MPKNLNNASHTTIRTVIRCYCVFPALQQAQRRALEEQHAANPPVKASRGIAVSAPPAGTTKKAAKAPPPAPAPAPEKISRSIPAAVPTVETPKLEPKAEPVAKPIPDEVQAPESEVVLLEQTPVTAEIEIPTPVTVEARAVETPSVKPSTVEANVVQEPEPKIPETEPITEVRKRYRSHKSPMCLCMQKSKLKSCLQIFPTFHMPESTVLMFHPAWGSLPPLLQLSHLRERLIVCLFWF